jgi:hypothetical protein
VVEAARCKAWEPAKMVCNGKANFGSVRRGIRVSQHGNSTLDLAPIATIYTSGLALFVLQEMRPVTVAQERNSPDTRGGAAEGIG